MKKVILFLIFYVSLFCLKAQDCSSCNATNWFILVPPGVSTTYLIPAELGANYVWLTTGGVSILSGQGTNTVTVLVNLSGKLSVTRFGSGRACANSAFIQAIQPSLSLASPCDRLSASIRPLPGVASYNWYADGQLAASTIAPAIKPPALNAYSAIQLMGRTFRAKTICVEGLNLSGQVVSTRFCIEVQPCPPRPLNLKLDCSNPISVAPVDAATKYNWYVNDVLIKSTNSPNLISQSSSNIGTSLSTAVFWLGIKMRFSGQQLKTFCVEAIDNTDQIVEGTLRTCIDIPLCISGNGENSGGGGGSGGSGGEDPIMQEAMQLSIYPNPSSSELIVSFIDDISEMKPYKLKIYNSKGTEVKSIEMTERKQKIYTGDLPKDNYIMKVINGKKIEIRRIVIQ